MKFEYEWSKEDLKKELIKKRKKTNITFFIIGIVLYLFVIYYPITSDMFDKKYLLTYGIGYVSALLFLILFFNKIYVLISLRKNDKDTNKAYGLYMIDLDNKKIKVSINDLVVEYDYKDITVLKKKKDRFFIRTKEDKIGLVFKEKVIGEDNYKKMLEIIEKNIQV